MLSCKEEEEEPVSAVKNEGIREEKKGGKSIGIDDEYERVHPICDGSFSQDSQSYGAAFHSNHHHERSYFPQYSGYSPHHPHLRSTLSFCLHVSY